MKKILIVFYILITCKSLLAQPHFITQGKIEYEKKQNMYKLLGDGFWSEEIKKQIPQFRSTYFNFYFTNKESLYKQGKESDERFKAMWNDLSADNIIYHNFDEAKTIQQKQIFEKKVLLNDSLLNFKWKITNDTRKIAGFECRKAIGKIMDSITIIAFYTDEILLPGGPESFNGLPGLILGVAFPRMHTTWFATKVELYEPQLAEIAKPEKGKSVTRSELIKTVSSATKDWGGEAEQNMLEMLF